MIDIQELRKLEPTLAEKTDEEITAIRNLLYQAANLALENFFEDKNGSKNPVGLLTSSELVK
jgi:hypothetical protein